jgi:hypothetical protein
VNHSPAEILAELLKVEGVLDDPSASSPSWPVYVSFTPDQSQDDVVTVYDTDGLKDGRLMTGEVIQHHGVQVRLRAGPKAYREGWKKLDEVRAFLETVAGTLVSMTSPDGYRVRNVSQVGTITPLGYEDGSKRRVLFTANFLLTIQPE